MNLTTGRIGIALADQVEEIRVNLKEIIQFRIREAGFGEIDVNYNFFFKYAEEMVRRKLQSERWVHFLTYTRKSIVPLRWGC